MINKTLSQKGSSHVVIIVALVLALVGALGFVFWQNFIHKEPVVKEVEVIKTDNQPKTNDSQKDNYSGWKSGSFKYAKLSYKLPPNWEDISDNIQFQDKYKYEEVKLKASDGFILTMSINNLPRGGEYAPKLPTVLEFKNIDETYQWIIADDTTGKVNRIYVGSGITKVGESTESYVHVGRDGMNIELAGSYEYTAKFDSLALFTDKQSVKEAKLVFESLDFN